MREGFSWLVLSSIVIISIMDMDKMISMGQSLGYKDKDLQQFIKEQQVLEREERAKVRELEKVKLERQMELEKAANKKEEQKVRLEEVRLEGEAKERQVELEKAKLAQQAAMEKDRLAHELELAKLGHSDSSKGEGTGKMPKLYKMPTFDEKVDNMDAYLRRVEDIAQSQKWPESEWARFLSTLLKGKALECYYRLSPTDRQDYNKVKEALLYQYDLTEDGFHQTFRTAKPETGETFSHFLVRIQNYFSRWVELSKTAKTFEGIQDLLMREQLLNVVGPNLMVFLRERNPGSATEMARLAQHYVDARGSTIVKPSRFSGNEKGNRVKGGRENGGSGQGFQQGQAKSSGQGSVYVPIKDRQCYICGQVGHIAFRCPKRGSKPVASVIMESVSQEVVSQVESETANVAMEESEVRIGEEGSVVTTGTVKEELYGTLPVGQGTVNGKPVQVLRDTGCTGVIVRKSLVSDSELTSEELKCVMADGRALVVPIAWITVDTPYYHGKVKAGCLEEPVYELILGNIPGARAPDNPFPKVESVAAVETRGQRKSRGQGMKPLKTMSSVGVVLSRDEFIQEQREDHGLESVRKLAGEGRDRHTAGGTSGYFMKEDILYRKYTADKALSPVIQLVVPVKLRSEVLKVCHESVMGGHMGVKKTLDRVVSQFYWPGVHGDVRRHCFSCDICQRTTPKGKIGKIPLGSMPLISTPFERIAVDLIGPLHPVTDRGNRYIITVVDYATRYPEAIALPKIETEYVAEALLEIFSRVGVPREILTDMGVQFTSAIMKEVCRLMSVKQLTTTPYHPMCNGLVERFNGTLKTMLKRLSAERPSDWDRYLPALLFAYREVPQESLGFAPFDLLYGRKVRGPVQILRELWSRDIPSEETRTTYQYVMDLQDRLGETIEIAHQALGKASRRYKKHFDVKTRDRRMNVGDKVLVLLSNDQNKLLLQWRGPYVIEAKFGVGDYRVRIGDKLKTYHANLLKKYVERQEVAGSVVCCDVSVSLPQYVSVGLVDVPEFEDEDESRSDVEDMPEIVTPKLAPQESYLDVNICPELSEEQQLEVKDLMAEFSDVLSDVPGRTDSIEFKIKLSSSEPVRSKPYPLPHHMRQVVAKEVQAMLDLDVIEPSESPYASPIVLVKKPDGSYRFCTDFRKLNQVTIFDSEPISLPESLFTQLSKCRYFSKIDISKAYWQIPVEEESKILTAFITPDGLYQWKVMPFGVVNAPAVFTRLMRKVLRGVDDVDSYIDDILSGTEEWDQQLRNVRSVFERLRLHHLTAKPSKVFIGYRTLAFLGHQIGEGQIAPDEKKLNKILDMSRPRTKKQVRAFIGLVGYYRKFIPNFAAIAAPLTDLTRKGEKAKGNEVSWGERQEEAFQTLRKLMSMAPILRLPDLEKPFYVRTDASGVGIGAVLLQEYGGEKFPVMYVSRKLVDRETRYSTIERECLAIVWGIQKLNRFLYGREFLLETDHKPLVWMTRAKLENGRVMRWALTLQPYRFLLRAVRGVENVGADLLSRCPP